MSQRIDYLDIAKGLGIIFVVMGHAQMPVGKYIYLFHIPLFFIVSGYFYNTKYDDDLMGLVKRRINRLYVPYIEYGLIFLFLHNWFVELGLYNSANLLSNESYISCVLDTLFFNSRESLLAPLWFLPVLFMTSILFSMLKKLVAKTKNGQLYIAGTTFILFGLGSVFTRKGWLSLTENSFVPEFLNVVFVAVFLYYCGFVYRGYDKRVGDNNTLCILSGLMLVLLPAWGGVDMRMNRYPDPAFLLAGAFSGVYLTFYISKILTKSNKVAKVLRYIGQHTIPIMAMHIVAFKVVSYTIIKVYDLPERLLGEFGAIDCAGWGLIYSVVGVVIPLCVHELASRFYHMCRGRLDSCFCNYER